MSTFFNFRKSRRSKDTRYYLNSNNRNPPPQPQATSGGGNKKKNAKGSIPRPSGEEATRRSQTTNARPPTSEAVATAATSSAPNTEQVARFVHRGWTRAIENLDTTDPECEVTYYREQGENTAMKDFKPLDLEEWCKKRREEKKEASSS